MVRHGLGPDWSCALANDLDPKKCATYRTNWGGKELQECDVKDVDLSGVGTAPDLAWASFPCQDLSMAGKRAGARAPRSGSVWAFWRHIGWLSDAGKKPKLVVLENVRGTASVRSGRDLLLILDTFRRHGYRCGLVILDASRFVPQSRSRIFFIGVDRENPMISEIEASEPSAGAYPEYLIRRIHALPPKLRANNIWLELGEFPSERKTLWEMLDDEPDVVWHSEAQTAHLISLMDQNNLSKVDALRDGEKTSVGTLFRRMRPTKEGKRVQRAEVRFDGLAGCLRVPSGGSSKLTLLFCGKGRVTSRLATPRECARLMGLNDEFILPASDTDAYSLTGDGVVTHKVAFLRDRIFDQALSLKSS